jgi:hypothetical protein
MSLVLPFSKRAFKYGYIFWKKSQDDLVQKFFGDITTVKIWFNNSYLGEKKVDWKYRRISLGYSKTRRLSDKLTEFVLTHKKDSSIKVVCR